MIPEIEQILEAPSTDHEIATRLYQYDKVLDLVVYNDKKDFITKFTRKRKMRNAIRQYREMQDIDPKETLTYTQLEDFYAFYFTELGLAGLFMRSKAWGLLLEKGTRIFGTNEHCHTFFASLIKQAGLAYSFDSSQIAKLDEILMASADAIMWMRAEYLYQHDILKKSMLESLLPK